MTERERQARASMANFYRKERKEGRKAVALAYYHFFKKQEQDFIKQFSKGTAGGDILGKSLGLL